MVELKGKCVYHFASCYLIPFLVGMLSAISPAVYENASFPSLTNRVCCHMLKCFSFPFKRI